MSAFLQVAGKLQIESRYVGGKTSWTVGGECSGGVWNVDSCNLSFGATPHTEDQLTDLHVSSRSVEDEVPIAARDLPVKVVSARLPSTIEDRGDCSTL